MFSHQYEGPKVHSLRPSKWGVAPHRLTTEKGKIDVEIRGRKQTKANEAPESQKRYRLRSLHTHCETFVIG